jgi:hypothetical protein
VIEGVWKKIFSKKVKNIWIVKKEVVLLPPRNEVGEKEGRVRGRGTRTEIDILRINLELDNLSFSIQNL